MFSVSSLQPQHLYQMVVKLLWFEFEANVLEKARQELQAPSENPNCAQVVVGRKNTVGLTSSPVWESRHCRPSESPN